MSQQSQSGAWTKGDEPICVKMAENSGAYLWLGLTWVLISAQMASLPECLRVVP